MTIEDIIQKWVAKNRLDSANHGISNEQYKELVTALQALAA